MPYDLLKEGDEYTADSLNARFTQAVAAVNVVGIDAIQEGSLGVVNLADGVSPAVLPTQYTIFQTNSPRPYTNLYPGWNTDIYDETGAGDGPYWTVAKTLGGALLRFLFPDMKLGMDQESRTAGLLVKASLERVISVPDADDSINPDLQAEASVRIALMVLLEIGPEGGPFVDTWALLPHTDRGLATDVVFRYVDDDQGSPQHNTAVIDSHASIDVATFITKADTGDGVTIKGVQVVCSMQLPAGLVTAEWYYETKNGDISVLPLHMSGAP